MHLPLDRAVVCKSEMAFNPGVSFFIPFDELDPSEQSQCIFFTQKGARCRWKCQKSDNKRAIDLHQTIIASPTEIPILGLLQDYVLFNCCGSGYAQHQDRIEDIGLLVPLARRWQNEIRTQKANQSSHTATVLTPGEGILITNVYPTPATLTPSPTSIVDSPTTSTSNANDISPASISIISTPSTSDTSLIPDENSPSVTSSTITLGAELSESEPRYALRPRQANISTNSTPTQYAPASQTPLSEFRPHIAEPHPSDSVSSKILEPLQDRDVETGSLYMFDRASSPGHVKIGWTARGVKRRLEDWSMCGYTPNLLFCVDSVPNAQRAETLTHHELINEWRRERMCKAGWCRKSHREWFETSKERAEQVLGGWADFFKKAEPYDSDNSLKTRWKEIVEMMDKSGETITAKKLLEKYELLVIKEEIVEEPLGTENILKIEAGEILGNELKREDLEDSKDILSCMNSQSIELQTLPLRIPRLEISHPKLRISPERDPLSEDQLIPGVKPILNFGPLSRGQLYSVVEPSKTTTPVFKTESLSENEQLYEDERVLKRTVPDEERNPELIPPPSPFVSSGLTTTSASPRRKPELSSNGPVLLGINTARVSPLPDTGEENKVEKLAQVAPCQRDDVWGELVEAMDKLLGSLDEDENTFIESETETEFGDWDEEETLLEDQVLMTLEIAAQKIVDGLSKTDSSGEPSHALKGLSGMKALESEVPLTLECVVSA